MNALLLVFGICLEDIAIVPVYCVLQKIGTEVFTYSIYNYHVFLQTIFYFFTCILRVYYKKVYFWYSVHYVVGLCEKIMCIILQQNKASKKSKMVLFGMSQVKHI